MKDRDLTEKKILDAVGNIIIHEGFENIGVNSVAQKAGVSKMLIYRYFGSLDELITKYILQKDYWINITVDPVKSSNLSRSIKQLFRQQIAQLREDTTLKRLYRWELSANNASTNRLREKREQNGCQLIKIVSELTHSSEKEVAALATILSASISYLALSEELNPTYNGINLQSEKGWEQIAEGMDLIIDLWLKQERQ
ncbi:TetR family transcriptional regulator [Porphyromonas macacae]|uniref:Transcriptional regulator BetI n=1 Tax=Porphyromonas macacae TaxID=28115 RepID=A0A379E8G3_9PORP|nr:TetR/AcrR family transcriptional regulator [Porphyromonas macacae]KGO00406.1 TetR family transcriptional regulator [Porphyromonas macacae]SUB88993.1 transcriptional regulator BetI [Porphyromonas macacae]